MPFINDPQGREEVEKVSRRLKLPVWKSFCKGNFRKWWNEWWDKIDTFAEEIEAIEIKTGTGLEGGGNLTKNRTLNLKKATRAELGGVIIGNSLNYNEATGVIDATDIKEELKGKVSKDGDSVSGNLVMRGSAPVEIDTTYLSEPWARGILYEKNGIIKGGIGAKGDPELTSLYIGIGNTPYENSELAISENDVVFRSKRLITNSQEGIAAINENNRNITGAIGKVDGSFPLTTAIKNNVYFLKSLNKSYICLKNYIGASISVPNINFEELSIYTNRVKLENIGAYDSSLVSTFPEFNTGLGIPLAIGNTISFTIGTNEALPTKGKYLGTALLKPRTPVSTTAVCVIPGVGVVGVIVVQINTSGAIEIIENIGVNPTYINTKSSYYATFNYAYIKED